MFNKLLANARGTYHKFSRSFWMMVIVNFIDRLGGSLLFPFFALYITKRFDVGMTVAGEMFAVWSISGFVSGVLGGALTDRFGRKVMIIFSLVATSVTALGFGFVQSLDLFFLIGFVSGLFTDIGWPAHNAIIADIVPEQKRAEAYGIIRVAFNLAVVIGPVIGGFLAARSYLALFIVDAVISLITAAIVLFAIPETKPEPKPGSAPESIAGSFAGYARAFRNLPFMLFTLASLLMALVYVNMNTTLGVYLRDVHAVPESSYGWILSLNAAMVVLFQFFITKRIEKFPPLLLVAIGTGLYAIGFALYGFIAAFWLFLFAMAVITIGEMVSVPVTQALVAKFSPEDMRGRYMAVYGYSWGIAAAVGPWAAGLLMDRGDPNWLWYACGIIGSISALGFLCLHGWDRHKTNQSAVSANPPPSEGGNS